MQFVKRVSESLLTCGARPGSALASPFHAPPKVEMLGEFSLVMPGLLGIAKKDKRNWVLICASSGKELLRGGGSAVVYELQSTDAKGNQERILLQKTDKIEELDHQKFECTLTSMAQLQARMPTKFHKGQLVHIRDKQRDTDAVIYQLEDSATDCIEQHPKAEWMNK